MSKITLKTRELHKNLINALNLPFLPGGVNEHYNVCGKSVCKCKNPDNPIKHGPYFNLSYTISKKSSSVNLKGNEILDAEKMTQNFKYIKDQLNELALVYFEQFKSEKVMPETNQISSNTKDSSLTISREKWKKKAISRNSELEVKRIKVRDLTHSRDKWKIKAMLSQENEQKLNQRLYELEEELLIVKTDTLKKKSK